MSDPKIERAVGPDAIFISYRRGDTAYPAGWLYHQLVAHFGAGQVFKDVDSIELGSDFVAEITTAVASCHCLLALIGRDWLTALDARGRRRLDDPADFVRLEIEAALTRDVRVIPVLVEDATMPYADELPPTLAPITRRQALVLSPTRFTADIAKLISVLERTFAEAAAARDAKQAPAEKVVEREEVFEPERPEAASGPPEQPEVASRPPGPRQVIGPPSEPEPRPVAATPAPVADLPKPDGPPAPDADVALEDAIEPALQRSARTSQLARAFIAAPVLFLAGLFLPWTTDVVGTRDGFSSPTLVLAWVLLLAAAGWVLLPTVGPSTWSPLRRAIVTLGLTGLALVGTVLVYFDARARGLADPGGLGLPRGSDRTAELGAHVGLVVAVIATVLAGLLLLAGRKGADGSAPPDPPLVDVGARSRYAVGGGSLVVAAVIGLIAHPQSTDETPAPYNGEHSWWSSYGNNLDTTLEATNPLNLNGASTAELFAQVNYEAEEGYDFLFGEISTDAGESWIRVNGTVAGESIWSESEGDTEGLSGTSGDADGDAETDWVPLKYDLSPWEGESEVWFRFRYITDSSSVSKGFFIDEVVIAGDLTMIVSDGAEAEDNGPWTSKGFVKSP